MESQFELELELRPTESIPMTQGREGAASLLSMDTSDDYMHFEAHAVDKPAVPKGAEPLAAYYEKQLAATQLVQHRLQKQYNQLSEEKASLEASLQVQTATLQRQLAVVHRKADHAISEAESTQEQVQAACAAVQEIVGSVTQLAEFLDESGATPELTRSFEAVAHSTQGTFQAISIVQVALKELMERQLEVRQACLASPLLASSSAIGGLPQVADALRDLEQDALRMRRELEDTRAREQQLDQELQAAQLLFTGLEAEVVSLQQDQAQAAAKLQVSQEELLSARAELVSAKQALPDVYSPSAEHLSRGLSKLDVHLASIREFMEGLSMPPLPPPPPPPATDTATSSPRQEQRASAQRHHSRAAERPGSASSISILQAVAASRATTAGGASVDTEAQVVLVTAERDAARQQLDLLAANLSLLEGRLEESHHDCDRLQHILFSTSQLLEETGAQETVLRARIAHLEDLVAARVSPDPPDSTNGDDEVGELPQLRHHSPSADSAVGGGSAGGDITSPTASTSSRGGSRIPRAPVGEQSPMGCSGGGTTPMRQSDAGTGAGRIPKPPFTTGGTDGGGMSSPGGGHAFLALERQLQELSAKMSATDLQFKKEEEARQAAEARADALLEEKELTAVLLHKLGSEQVALAEQLQALEAAKEALEEEREQLLARSAYLKSHVGDLAEERDMLMRRVNELAAQTSSLADERDYLLQRHEREVGVAAAAGAAGAAAAVAVAHDAVAATGAAEASSASDLPGPVSPTGAPLPDGASVRHNVLYESSLDGQPHEEASFAAMEHRLAELEGELMEVADARDIALQRASRLEEEIVAMGELLAEAASEREAALQQVEHVMEECAGAEERHAAERYALEDQLQSAESAATAATAAAAAAAAGATAGALSSSGTGYGLPLGAGSPLLPSRAGLSRSNSNSRRSRSHRASTAEEPDGHFTEADGLHQSRSVRLSTPTGLLHTSSFMSEMPIFPTHHHGDGSGTHGYLDPTDLMDDAALHPPTTSRPRSGSLPRVGSSQRPSSGLLPGTPRQQHQQQQQEQGAAEEVAQLQAAVCSLLVSKAMASAQMQAEHEAQMSMLCAAHQSEMLLLRDEHATEVAELQAAIAAAADDEQQDPNSPAAARQYADQSTRMSERSLPGGQQLEAQLLQQIAALETQLTELQEDHEAMVSDSAAHVAQLQTEHDSQLAALQDRHEAELSELESAHHERLAAVQEQSGADSAAELQAQLSQSKESHDSVVSTLQQQLEDLQEHAVQCEARALDLQAQLSQQQAELEAQMAEQQVELEAQMAEHQDAHKKALGAMEERLSDAGAQAQQSAVLAAELQEQLQQIQSEKEVEEQSLQSLMRTKAWMTEEIRSLQGDLKDARVQLSESEAELTVLRASATAVPAAVSVSRSAGHAAGHNGASTPRGSSTATAAPQKAVAGSMGAGDAVEEEPSTLAGLAKHAAKQAMALKQAQAAGTAAGATSGAVVNGAGPAVKGAGAAPKGAAAAAKGVGMTATDSAAAHADVGSTSDVVALRKKLKVAERQIAALGDQLAELTMQAALAEARLEGGESQHQSSEPGGGAAATVTVPSPGSSGPPRTMAQTDLMMETVALHGELDEVKGKQRVLQGQMDSITDEMVYAVMRAALAESQLEHARLQMADGRGSGSGGGGGGLIGSLLMAAPGARDGMAGRPAAAGKSKACVLAALAAPPRKGHGSDAVKGGVSSAGNGPAGAPAVDLKRNVFADKDQPPPDHLGTKAVSPLEQTRHLKSELQAVARALGELFGDDQPIEAPSASRQTLSSLRPAVIAALHMTENVATSLQKQQNNPASKPPPAPESSQPGKHARSVAILQPDLDRARTAYRDARDVFDMLRSDAEDLNSRLWRWGAGLRSQVTALEKELARVQSTSLPDPPLSWENAMAQRDAVLRSTEEELAELQGGLRTAHVRLLRRDTQVATLQDMLVQLSEQVTMFEGVVVRCEVLSTDLITKTGIVGAGA